MLPKSPVAEAALRMEGEPGKALAIEKLLAYSNDDEIGPRSSFGEATTAPHCHTEDGANES